VTTPDDGVDRGQLLLVSVCLVGVVLAAFLAPVTGESDAIGVDGDALPTGPLEFLSDPTDGDGRDPPDDGGDGDAPTGWIGELLEWLPGEGAGSGGDGTPSRCEVSVRSDLTPGRPTTVLVTVDREPVSDVRVWFNDGFVGRTDDQGRVTADAPYAQELNVTVESPIDEPCAFSRRPSLG